MLNGCRDNTRAVVEDVAASASEVRIVEFAEPLGKGGAIHRGLDMAGGELLAYVDADNMVRAGETVRLIDALSEHSIAIADRFNGTQTNGGQPLLRRVVSRASRLWVRRYLGLPYSDTQCGAKAFRAEAWRAIAPHIREHGWAFDLEALAHARRLGLSVAEAPVELAARGGGLEGAAVARRPRDAALHAAHQAPGQGVGGGRCPFGASPRWEP